MGSKHSRQEMNKKDDSDSESENLEICEEADVIDEDEESFEAWFGRCKKASQHDKFIPIKSLTLKDLPDTIRHPSILQYIQHRSKLVVKLEVGYTSMARPDNDKFAAKRGKRVGHCATGYAWQYNLEQKSIPCPNEQCRINKKGPHNVFLGILVTTNRHVIFNDEEAEQTVVNFFYDDDDENKNHVVKGSGIALREELEKKDYVSLKFYHHDESLFDEISKVNEEIMEAWESIPTEYILELDKKAIVVSHPHGNPKIVSFGDLLMKEEFQKDKGRKVTKYTSATCEGSSGAPVLTASYMTNPFVHSSGIEEKKNKRFLGMSFSY